MVVLKNKIRKEPEYTLGSWIGAGCTPLDRGLELDVLFFLF
jgi:hypothetical protein